MKMLPQHDEKRFDIPLKSGIHYKFEPESSVRFNLQFENRYFVQKFASAYGLLHVLRTAYHAFAYGVRSKRPESQVRKKGGYSPYLIKRRDIVYKFMTQNPHMYKTKSKARQQRFYSCFSSQSHSEAFNTEQTLTPHCKFKTAPITGILCILAEQFLFFRQYIY